MDPGELCRKVESYLCSRNDGHLVRIVGPAFEMVCGWASAGIPLSVVERAIDRTAARYYAKGPRRRPLRIEYCEADTLDLFDEWKRAVGVGTSTAPAGESDAEESGATGRPGGSGGRRSLAAHLDGLAARLSAWNPPPDGAALERLLDEARICVDGARAADRTLRGEARRLVLEQLAELDRRLPAVARTDAGEAVLRELRAEAQRSLEAFRSRMPVAAFESAVDTATDRLLAEHFELPRLTFD